MARSRVSCRGRPGGRGGCPHGIDRDGRPRLRRLLALQNRDRRPRRGGGDRGIDHRGTIASGRGHDGSRPRRVVLADATLVTGRLCCLRGCLRGGGGGLHRCRRATAVPTERRGRREQEREHEPDRRPGENPSHRFQHTRGPEGCQFKGARRPSVDTGELDRFALFDGGQVEILDGAPGDELPDQGIETRDVEGRVSGVRIDDV